MAGPSVPLKLSNGSLERVPPQTAPASNVNMAPVRSNADGADRGDGLESDRKVRRFVSAELQEFCIDLRKGDRFSGRPENRWWRSKEGLESTRVYKNFGSSSLTRT